MTEQAKPVADELVEDLLWRFGEAEFDERAGVLKLAGIEIELEPRPLEVLGYLLRHAGEVVTKEELLEAVWRRKPELISDKVLSNAIGKLRRELKDEREAIIVTLPRRGYRLSVPVSRVVIGRRAVPKLDFKAGDKVPRREQWRLVQALDESGRGEVWLAEHDKTRARRVFKFSADGTRLSALKREVTLSRVLRESLGERADLVPVLEWNFEEAPYFIECEDGGPDWLRWASAQGGLSAVSLEQRLSMFVQAAEAIGAAHGVGVLHKDIKPANLLIGVGADGRAQVRVTDFGSGRLLEPGRLDALGITRLGFTQTQAIGSDSLTGTPLYLAPELLTGQAPTQASDVHALGVLLYQLVVADFRKPLSTGWEREVDDELLREDISQAAAGDPSLRLDSARALAQRVARLSVRRIERAMVLRDRAEADIARLALARARQRRPWVIVAASAAALGIAVSLLALHRVSAARAKADQRLAATQALNDFLQDGLLAKANPYIAGKEDLSVREAVDAAAAEIDERFALQPQLAAATHHSMGLAYNALSRSVPARQHLEKAVGLYASALGLTAPETLAARIDLALEQGRASDFPAMRVQLDAIQASIAGASVPIRVDALFAEGNYRAHQAQFAEAVPVYERALAMAGDHAGIKPRRRLRMQHNLALSYVRSGRVEQGERQQREILAFAERTFGSDHPEAMDARLALGSTLSIAKRDDEAEPILRTAVADFGRRFGASHDQTLDAMSNLAACLNQKGDFAGAVAVSEDKLRRIRARSPDAPPDRTLTVALMDLGNQLRAAGRAAEAIPILEQAIQAAAKVYGDRHAYRHISATTLATAYLDNGNRRAARLLLASIDADAIKVVIAATGWSGWEGQPTHQRARIMEAKGDLAAARMLYQTAITQLSRAGDPKDPQLLLAQVRLAKLTP